MSDLGRKAQLQVFQRHIKAKGIPGKQRYRKQERGLKALQRVWRCQSAKCTVWGDRRKQAGRSPEPVITHLFKVPGLLYVWGQMQTSQIDFSPKEPAVNLAERVLQPLALLCAPLGHHEHHTQQSQKPSHAGPIRHCMLHCLSHFPLCQSWQNSEELSTNWIWDDSLQTKDLKLENLSSNTLAVRLLVQLVQFVVWEPVEVKG